MRLRLQLYAAMILAALLAVPGAQPTIQADILDVGTQTGTFTNWTRGYWFTAPVDFVIDGISVVTDASVDPQSAEILRFNSAVPGFPSTTNDFSSLFSVKNDASLGFISTGDILIDAGDIIGVLGSRGAGTNSYGVGPYTSSILGMSVDLTRLGMQADLGTNPVADVWQSSGGSIGRVQLSFHAVPEPTSALVMGIGACGLILRRRRR